MGARINSLGVVVKGSVRRVRDADADTTTLDFTPAQVREAYEALGAAVKFFDMQATSAAPAEVELPLGPP